MANQDSRLSDPATQADIALVRKDIDAVRAGLGADIDIVRKDMDILRAELTSAITTQGETLRKEAQETKSILIQWMAGLAITQTTLTVALIKLIH
jgi:CBS-domain-containing membrane protein